jgi:hypothetical protein
MSPRRNAGSGSQSMLKSSNHRGVLTLGCVVAVAFTIVFQSKWNNRFLDQMMTYMTLDDLSFQEISMSSNWTIYIPSPSRADDDHRYGNSNDDDDNDDTDDTRATKSDIESTYGDQTNWVTKLHAINDERTIAERYGNISSRSGVGVSFSNTTNSSGIVHIVRTRYEQFRRLIGLFVSLEMTELF